MGVDAMAASPKWEDRMTIITISKGSYQYGAEVAGQVARRLGFACIGREVLLEASRDFDIPEARLVRAVIDSPSILDRLTEGKQRHVAYIRAALLSHCCKDQLVYHGFAGQVFLEGIAHVLRVRVIADPEHRIGIVMERDAVAREQALATIDRDDQERVRWSRNLYGVDIRQPGLYDMVLKIDRLSVEQAAELICATATQASFQTTVESQRCLEDLALGAAVHAALLEVTVDVAVVATRGEVTVKTRKEVARVRGFADHLEEKARSVAGVRSLQVTADLSA